MPDIFIVDGSIGEKLTNEQSFNILSAFDKLHGDQKITDLATRTAMVQTLHEWFEKIVSTQLNPESKAMLQALYSRSAESVTTHLERVMKSGSKKFMESFYVGYGHSSIGDCGTTTIFIEDVSMLVAKAIQDNEMYSGQETSTRYIDFSEQRFHDPVDSKASNNVMKDWRDFYIKGCPVVEESLKERFPLEDGQDPVVWGKAVKAKTFDVMRGFLPAGATTKLSWTTNLRQAYDHLTHLKTHPLLEVRHVAFCIEAQLKDKYPSSFSHRPDPARDLWMNEGCHRNHYVDSCVEPFSVTNSDVNAFVCDARYVRPVNVSDLSYLMTRPERTLVPKYFQRYGVYLMQFLMDFGSFRDVQRHRGGMCRIPLITGDDGFHPWYLEQLPDDLRAYAKDLLEESYAVIDGLENCNKYEAQYFMPMGTIVPVELAYSIPQMVYVAELRSSNTVHPTLRPVAQKMAEALHDRFPEIKLHVDKSEGFWDIKRGLHDIVEK